MTASHVNLEPPKAEKNLGKDMKAFEQLPAKNKELELFKDQAKKATGEENIALNRLIRDKSK